MKKISRLLLTALTLAVFGLSSFQPLSAETLRVGMECTYAPFNFKDADGNLHGL